MPPYRKALFSYILPSFNDLGATPAKTQAYRAIKEVLANEIALASFSPDIVGAQFLEATRESLAVLPPLDDGHTGNSTSTSSITTTVAIAFASVFFVVTSIFTYGIVRRRRLTTTSSKKKSPLAGKLGIRNGNYFERMIDGCENKSTKGSPIGNRIETRSVNRSVSDITSDSGKSNHSITTSRLAKIEEENSHECMSSEQEDVSGSMVSPVLEYLSSPECDDMIDTNDYGPAFLYHIDPASVDDTLPPSPSKEGEDAQPCLNESLAYSSSVSHATEETHETRDEICPSTVTARQEPVEPRDDAVNQSTTSIASDFNINLWFVQLLLKLHVSPHIKRIEQ